MIKIQKKAADGKTYDYWQYTEEEIAAMKAEAEKRKVEMDKARKESK